MDGSVHRQNVEVLPDKINGAEGHFGGGSAASPTGVRKEVSSHPFLFVI